MDELQETSEDVLAIAIKMKTFENLIELLLKSKESDQILSKLLSSIDCLITTIENLERKLNDL
jgi:hypothetical protein